MNQQEALRRLEALEAQARLAEVERARHDPEFRAQAAELALELDMTVEHVIDELLAIARRIAEIGQDAFDQEFAAELGVTVTDLRSDAWRAEQERNWQAFKAWDRARRAEIVHYRQGVMYRGGVPVTS